MGLNLSNLKLKVCINKKNGQCTLTVPKKVMPSKLKESIEKQPEAVKYLLMQFRGFENS